MNRYYFAPMEGITDSIYRNAHRHWFHPADKYFTAFLVPDQGRQLPDKILKEVNPDTNKDIYLVPQILTNKAGDFLDLAEKLFIIGYSEININMGCPSKTVTAKKKGSGFLAFPGAVHVFLERIFESPLVAGGQLKISVKTRLGVTDPDEFETLLEIFNEYPLHELILHPRVQKEFYQGEVHLDKFTLAYQRSSNPLCYNGNLFQKEDFETMQTAFLQTDRWMAGRGLLKNPGLFGEVHGEPGVKQAQLIGFHDEIYKRYQESIPREKALLSRMKEFWSSLGGCSCKFISLRQQEIMQHLFRAQSLAEYAHFSKSLLYGDEIQEETDGKIGNNG